MLDRDEVPPDGVIADFFRGLTPCQICGCLQAEAYGTVPAMDASADAHEHMISHETIYTWIDARPKKTLIVHGIYLPSSR